MKNFSPSRLSPSRIAAHESFKKKQEKLKIEQENLRISNALLELATNRNTFIDHLEKDSKAQQKYKALHCKYPVLDMSENKFSPNRKIECSRMSPSKKQNSNADYKKFRLSSQKSRESY